MNNASKYGNTALRKGGTSHIMSVEKLFPAADG